MPTHAHMHIHTGICANTFLLALMRREREREREREGGGGRNNIQKKVCTTLAAMQLWKEDSPNFTMNRPNPFWKKIYNPGQCKPQIKSIQVDKTLLIRESSSIHEKSSTRDANLCKKKRKKVVTRNRTLVTHVVNERTNPLTYTAVWRRGGFERT